MAVFSRLAPALTTAYASQALFAMAFVPQQNDKYFDLGGAVGWVSTAFISLYYPALKAKFLDGIQKPLPSLSTFPPHKLALTAAVTIWSIKLGSFLVLRAIKSGGDSRFDQIKKQPVRYSISWFGQATWIALVGLPVWLVNTSQARLSANLSMRDYAALGIYIGGILFETFADYQKFAWRKAKDLKQHNENFISSGLWSISRHPNYVGEVGVWTGIWALSTIPLQSAFPSGTVVIAAISPLFTWFLLRKVTGIPLLERAGDEKFGDNPKWQGYKRTVPILFPWGGVE